MRVILSIVLGVLDTLRGDWQLGVLSILGVINSQAVVVGFFLKLLRRSWLFIAPDLRRQLQDDIYKSGKSMTVGFMMWMFTVFSPDMVRLAAQKSFDSMAEVVNNFNEKIGDVEAKAQEVGSAAGLQVTFPKIPLQIVPSFDDIQNLQSIARVPEIYCSAEVQQIIEPLLLVPPLRLILELMNIPTVASDVDATCGGLKGTSLVDSLVEKATPKVTVLPGGPLNQAQSAVANAQSAMANAQSAVADVAATASDPTAALAATASKKAKATRKARKSSRRFSRRNTRS